MIAAALVLCIPWLAYTHSKTDRLFLWGNSGSLSLYWMTSPYHGDVGDWQQANDVFTDPALAPHRPFFETLRGLTLADQNARIEHEAVRNIVHHPESYASHVAANISRILFNEPYSRTPRQANDLFYVVSNAVVIGGVALCLVVLLRRRSSLPVETVPFLVLAVTAFGVHALLSAYPRMLMPLVPFVGWFTSLALVDVGALSRLGVPRGTREQTGIA
jgi:hypothetical protein